MEVEKIAEELKKIKTISGFVLARNDGSFLNSKFPPETSKMLAVMTAAIIKSSVISSRELKIGDFSYALVKASKGFYLCVEISSGLILGCLFEKKIGFNQALKNIQNLRKLFI